LVRCDHVTPDRPRMRSEHVPLWSWSSRHFMIRKVAVLVAPSSPTSVVIDAGQRPGTTTEDSAQLKAMKKENAELKRATRS
jgi:hypothetical protein